jgi:5S rRNA maturation endonuclease (ribonuclease M5)
MKFDANKWVRGKFEHVNAGQYEVAICCPMCDDKRFRFYICTNPNQLSKSGKLFACYCHNEQQAYSLAEVYSIVENIHIAEAHKVMEGTNEESAYSEFDGILDLLLEDDRKVIVEKKERKIVPLPDKYIPLHGISRDRWESIIPTYLKDVRKLSYETCNKYQLGFTLNGYSVWSNRLVIPIYLDNELITYQGRFMGETKNKKYYFETIRDEFIKIGDCLYNIDNIDKKQRYVILCEGAFDVWAIVRAGYTNCVASFGKHLTDNALNRIIRDFDRIYILWDKDAKLEIEKLVKRLRGFVEVYIVKLDGKDPDASTSEAVKLAIESSEPYSSDSFFDNLLDILG